MNLIEAAKRGDVYALQGALLAGAAVDAADSTGLTALLWATIGRDSDCVRKLLEAGAEMYRDVLEETGARFRASCDRTLSTDLRRLFRIRAEVPAWTTLEGLALAAAESKPRRAASIFRVSAKDQP